MHIYIYIYIRTHVDFRHKNSHKYTRTDKNTHTHIHTHTHIYIYIYILGERKREWVGKQFWNFYCCDDLNKVVILILFVKNIPHSETRWESISYTRKIDLEDSSKYQVATSVILDAVILKIVLGDVTNILLSVLYSGTRLLSWEPERLEY